MASLFREAGFPPGVVNFLLHRPEDASEIFDTLITHRAVKKCNFTGSTQVGRIIASQAAMALKPVLLELGGKNFTIVLEDANLDLAAQEIVKGAFLNVSESIAGIVAAMYFEKSSHPAPHKIEWPDLYVHRHGNHFKRRRFYSRSQDFLLGAKNRSRLYSHLASCQIQAGDARGGCPSQGS